jgi:hypothetical protein
MGRYQSSGSCDARLDVQKRKGMILVCRGKLSEKREPRLHDGCRRKQSKKKFETMVLLQKREGEK